MARPLVSCALTLLSFAIPATAQMGVGDGEGPYKRPATPAPLPRQIFISGKVVTQDGSPPPDRAEVETVCNGLKRSRALTDSHGGFSFGLSSEGSTFETQSAAAGSDTSWGGPMASGKEPEWQGCELQAELAGFTSERISFAHRIQGLGQVNVGQLVLHSAGQQEGLTISVTTALAPESAKRAFRKGLELEKTNNWQDAQAAFQKAVDIYPNYASAWFEKGRAEEQTNHRDEARQSWQHAVTSDSKYVPPYQMLAQLAASEARWQDLVLVTSKWIALDATDFVDAWFLNAVGHYFTGNLPSAEQSARQGIKLDQAHRIPKLQYLLGMMLLQRRAYAEADEHMQMYLHMVNKPADVNEAQKQVAEIERLSTMANAGGTGSVRSEH